MDSLFDFVIRDILLSNYYLYASSQAPDVIDVWQWLYQSGCPISINYSYVTDKDNIIQPVVVAEYQSSSAYFRDSGSTIASALHGVMLQMAISCDNTEFIHFVSSPK